ncbi:MAG: hypothetical protein ACRCVI_01555 [Mycoplasmoidaceae bacterium]
MKVIKLLNLLAIPVMGVAITIPLVSCSETPKPNYEEFKEFVNLDRNKYELVEQDNITNYYFVSLSLRSIKTMSMITSTEIPNIYAGRLEINDIQTKMYYVAKTGDIIAVDGDKTNSFYQDWLRFEFLRKELGILKWN